jgi:hypothetical protein
VDNPLNLYFLDISLLSDFTTQQGSLCTKQCRFEIPLVRGLSPGTVGPRRPPCSYITHMPDVRLSRVLGSEFVVAENALWRGMRTEVMQW